MVSKNIGKGYTTKQRFGFVVPDIIFCLNDVVLKIKKGNIIKYRQNPMKTLLYAISMIVIRLSLTGYIKKTIKIKGELFMNKNKIKSVVIALIVIILMSNTIIGMSSARAELISPEKLPSQVNEGETVSFIIKINDYSDAKSITIDTSLIGSGNNPIYDFGDLNPSITASRYNPTIILDVSSLPLKEFKVTISGRAPMGETRVPIQDTNIIVSKLDKAKKKFYEVIVDKKSMNIESFELLIKSNEEFTKTTDKLQWKEFDGIKKETEKMFSNGLTSEAQNIANELTKINIPNNLLLFGIFTIDNNLLLNIIVICFAIFGFIVGFKYAGGKPDDEGNED